MKRSERSADEPALELYAACRHAIAYWLLEGRDPQLGWVPFAEWRDKARESYELEKYWNQVLRDQQEKTGARPKLPEELLRPMVSYSMFWEDWRVLAVRYVQAGCGKPQLPWPTLMLEDVLAAMHDTVKDLAESYQRRQVTLAAFRRVFETALERQRTDVRVVVPIGCRPQGLEWSPRPAGGREGPLPQVEVVADRDLDGACRDAFVKVIFRAGKAAAGRCKEVIEGIVREAARLSGRSDAPLGAATGSDMGPTSNSPFCPPMRTNGDAEAQEAVMPLKDDDAKRLAWLCREVIFQPVPAGKERSFEGRRKQVVQGLVLAMYEASCAGYGPRGFRDYMDMFQKACEEVHPPLSGSAAQPRQKMAEWLTLDEGPSRELGRLFALRNAVTHEASLAVSALDVWKAWHLARIAINKLIGKASGIEAPSEYGATEWEKLLDELAAYFSAANEESKDHGKAEAQAGSLTGATTSSPQKPQPKPFAKFTPEDWTRHRLGRNVDSILMDDGPRTDIDFLRAPTNPDALGR